MQCLKQRGEISVYNQDTILNNFFLFQLYFKTLLLMWRIQVVKYLQELFLAFVVSLFSTMSLSAAQNYYEMRKIKKPK